MHLRLDRILQATMVITAAIAGLTGGFSAHAEFKVRYPVIDYREFEVEHNGAVTFDKKNSGKNYTQSYPTEVEVGILPFWAAGIEANIAANTGENVHYQATALESYLQLTPQGKYWADLAFFTEFEHPVNRNSAHSVTFGPLVQKEVSNIFGIDTLHTLNVLFEKEIGHQAAPATPLFVAWQSRLRLDPRFEPGVEFYGAVDDLAHPGRPADQQHRVGPMIAGLYSFAPYGKLKYELGYLVGLTRATETGAVRWRLEYEIAF
jgi:hypothetical protein